MYPEFPKTLLKLLGNYYYFQDLDKDEKKNWSKRQKKLNTHKII